MIDSGLAVPLQMLALIILALLAISGPLSLAFLRVSPGSDRE
jgi:hypothetical protein